MKQHRISILQWKKHYKQATFFHSFTMNTLNSTDISFRKCQTIIAKMQQFDSEVNERDMTLVLVQSKFKTVKPQQKQRVVEYLDFFYGVGISLVSDTLFDYFAQTSKSQQQQQQQLEPEFTEEERYQMFDLLKKNDITGVTIEDFGIQYDRDEKPQSGLELKSLRKLKIDTDKNKILDWIENYKGKFGSVANAIFISQKLDGVSVQMILSFGSENNNQNQVQARDQLQIKMFTKDSNISHFAEHCQISFETNFSQRVKHCLEKYNLNQLVLRGEMMVSIEDFEDYQQEFEEENNDDNQALFSSPRQFVVSNIKRKTIDRNQLERMRILCYETMNIGVSIDQQFQIIQDLGIYTPKAELVNVPFDTSKKARKDLQIQEEQAEQKINLLDVAEVKIEKKDVMKDLLHNYFEGLTRKLCMKSDIENYVCDGIVIHTVLDFIKTSAQLQQYTFAYKSIGLQEFVDTTVNQIVFQAGKTGNHTPILMIEPVKIQGKIIRKVTCHNKEKLKEMGIKIGTKIQVTLAGSVIPQISKVYNCKESNLEKVNNKEEEEETKVNVDNVDNVDDNVNNEVNTSQNNTSQNSAQNEEDLKSQSLVCQVYSFLSSLGLKGINKKTLAILITELNFETIEDVLQIEKIENLQATGIQSKKDIIITNLKQILDFIDSTAAVPEFYVNFLLGVRPVPQVTFKLVQTVFQDSANTGINLCKLLMTIYIRSQDNNKNVININNILIPSVGEKKIQKVLNWIDGLVVMKPNQLWNLNRMLTIAFSNFDSSQLDNAHKVAVKLFQASKRRFAHTPFRSLNCEKNLADVIKQLSQDWEVVRNNHNQSIEMLVILDPQHIIGRQSSIVRKALANKWKILICKKPDQANLNILLNRFSADDGYDVKFIIVGEEETYLMSSQIDIITS